MKSITEYIVESKQYVRKNELRDKSIQDKIYNGDIDSKLAQEILFQYETDHDAYEEAGYDGDIDQLSMEVDFKDYIDGELKGSIEGDIDTQLDILGVDKWYFGILCILNKELNKD